MTVAPGLVWVGARLSCRNRFEEKLAAFLGWLSYPVYCLHFPIGRIVWLWGRQAHLSDGQMILDAALMTLVCASLLAKGLEEPSRRWLAQKLLPKKA